MNRMISIVDYGLGNLFSVQQAFKKCGAETELVSTATRVESSGKIVLPGVGAFADGMQGLANRGLVKALKDYVDKGAPFLGICLGMQMMLNYSEEFGRHAGLGIIPGKVVRIPETGTDGKKHKIPLIGWNQIVKTHLAEWEGTILEKVPESASTYFVHSYMVVPNSEEHMLADTFYNGVRISAVIKRGNAYGCQFHPEKSGPVGLSIIKKFIEL